MTDDELDALVERLRRCPGIESDDPECNCVECIDAISALRQERDAYKSGVRCPNCDNLRLELGAARAERDTYRNGWTIAEEKQALLLQERDAARAQVEKLRALLRRARDAGIYRHYYDTKMELHKSIDAALAGKDAS